MITCLPSVMGSQVEGFWYSARAGVAIEVQDTYDGIRVKRTDQDRWRYYDAQRSARFVDPQGNSYEMEGRNQLHWISRNKRQIITFERSQYDDGNVPGGDYGYDDWYDDGYFEDGLEGLHADGSYCPAGFRSHHDHRNLTRAEMRRLRRLEGRWTGWRGRGLMEIRVNRKAVHVEYNGRHLHFYPSAHDQLVADNGMRMLTSGRNRLILRTHRGRPIAFSRGRTVNNYCD